jgi:hypothetical protein
VIKRMGKEATNQITGREEWEVETPILAPVFPEYIGTLHILWCGHFGRKDDTNRKNGLYGTMRGRQKVNSTENG